ncbi:hypothetical protein OLX02_03605 [Novosphingobium sp. KCTC 2891]|uniref:tetratricopeptide repeat protein n=1 Tax=Novosphingobium sp. KCTC 2891 TaxID=2989730 RepID=UPI0022231AA0|nr:hypothetical protein [Novosphingobium sp. KCTC 2891]MCW1381900.1 hypothetical protein [Novosphingobium sp. KCTC 2891]
MTALHFATGRQTILAVMVAAGSLVAATTALMPNASDIAAALQRAKPPAAKPQLAPPPANTAPARTPDVLSTLFAQGAPLQTTELRQLLAYSAKTGNAGTLSAIADRLAEHEPVPTAQVTYDILASGRPDVARAFLESRPERSSAENWRLRLELHRQTGDLAFAQSMVRAAATAPGSVAAPDLVAGAYAAGVPDAILTAAEHRAIPPLSRAQSLDLARQAVASGRIDMIARIDRAGTPAWRDDDPWAAMSLAQRAGDTAGALRYAALLPNGAAEAKRSIIMASGDKQAIRAILLEQGRSDTKALPVAAQQLLESGFRPDAVALLRAGCANCAPDDPIATRLLFLMGPRPDADGLGWLRAKAGASPAWLKIYAERERPAIALAFLETRPDADSTAMLLQRLRLATDARDKAAASRALGHLLDGRPLSAPQALAMTAASPPRLDAPTVLALTQARVRAGAALPKDRLDLAWDGWNRGDANAARDQLKVYLASAPADPAALRLMAAIEKKRLGDKAARGWLEQALAATPPATPERAELLEQLGRTNEALALVQSLRQSAPGNRKLEAMNGRLLIAAGDPGRARKVLKP